MSPTTKSEADSLIANVSVAVCPKVKLVLLLTSAIVGGVVSKGTVFTEMVTMLFASEPSTLKFPAASENLLFTTLTTPLVVLLGLGVKIAE